MGGGGWMRVRIIINIDDDSKIEKILKSNINNVINR